MPIVTAKKLRKVELTAGAAARHGGGTGNALNREQRRQLERRSAQAAESAYRRNVADWQRQQMQRARTARTAISFSPSISSSLLATIRFKTGSPARAP